MSKEQSIRALADKVRDVLEEIRLVSPELINPLETRHKAMYNILLRGIERRERYYLNSFIRDLNIEGKLSDKDISDIVLKCSAKGFGTSAFGDRCLEIKYPSMVPASIQSLSPLHVVDPGSAGAASKKPKVVTPISLSSPDASGVDWTNAVFDSNDQASKVEKNKPAFLEELMKRDQQKHKSLGNSSQKY